MSAHGSVTPAPKKESRKSAICAKGQKEAKEQKASREQKEKIVGPSSMSARYICSKRYADSIKQRKNELIEARVKETGENPREFSLKIYNDVLDEKFQSLSPEERKVCESLAQQHIDAYYKHCEETGQFRDGAEKKRFYTDKFCKECAKVGAVRPHKSAYTLFLKRFEGCTYKEKKAESEELLQAEEKAFADLCKSHPSLQETYVKLVEAEKAELKRKTRTVLAANTTTTENASNAEVTNASLCEPKKKRRRVVPDCTTL